MHNIKDKIVALHGLPLPSDMIHEICGYCFYDNEASMIRDKKREIMNAVLSEANRGNSDLKYSNAGTWWFIYKDKNSSSCVSMFPDFCVDCGNYRACNHGYINFSVKCYCVDYYDLQEEEFTYEDEVREFKQHYWLFGW